MQTIPEHHTQEQSHCRPPIKVIPLETFGAEIIDFDFDSKASPEQARILRSALLDYKMLLLRNRTLTPDEQIAFTRLFGDELHRAGPRLRHLERHPEIFRIANRNGNGNVNTGNYWHSDGHYLRDPSAVTVMHIVSATSDGATQVTDSAAAFDRLTDATKDYLSKLAFRAPETGVVHPIVRRHPMTGRPSLYVNLIGVAINSDFQQLPHVKQFILSHLSEHGTFYEHHWQPGDTMVVDNFATIHRGTASNPKDLRIMHRTTVTGRSVWWRT